MFIWTTGEGDATRDVTVLRSLHVPCDSQSKEPTSNCILVVRRSCSGWGRGMDGMLSIEWPGQKGVGLEVEVVVDSPDDWMS
eukprot:12595457-Ditylum_brightwellii.AAC.1